MDVSHVTRFLLVACLVALVACSPLPYGVKPYQYPLDWNNDYDYRYDAHNFQRDLDKLKILLSLDKGDANHKTAHTPGPSDGQLMSKRFDFGMSGLDNIDHILTTLDQGEASRPQGRTLKQQFMVPGSRYRDINRLKQLMESVG